MALPKWSRQSDSALPLISSILAEANIQVNGGRPHDMLIHHPRTADRILATRLDEKVDSWALLKQSLRARLLNLQNESRSRQAGEVHYDLGNDFFAAMLDEHLAYTCAYWEEADALDAAQTAKLELVCRKLGLRPGMRLLDIGCGWGSLMKFAAERLPIHGSIAISFPIADYPRWGISPMLVSGTFLSRTSTVSEHTTIARCSLGTSASIACGVFTCLPVQATSGPASINSGRLCCLPTG